MAASAIDKMTSSTKAGAEALAKSGNATISGYQELAKAYQELAARNAEKLTASLQALVAAKNPTEFLELQQKLVKDAVDSAVADSKKIADLTMSVFTAAAEPIQAQIKSVQDAITK